MPERDTTDYVAAFAVGAILAAGAALLFRPKRSRKERILKQIEPHRKRARKSMDRARKGFREGAGATAEMSEELLAASREVLGEFRDEVADIVAGARHDIADAVDEQVKEARRAIKRGRKRLNI